MVYFTYNPETNIYLGYDTTNDVLKDKSLSSREISKCLNDFARMKTHNCVMRELMIGRGLQCVWKVTIKQDKEGKFKTFYRSEKKREWETNQSDICHDDCVQGFKLDCEHYFPVIAIIKNRMTTKENIERRKRVFRERHYEACVWNLINPLVGELDTRCNDCDGLVNLTSCNKYFSVRDYLKSIAR